MAKFFKTNKFLLVIVFLALVLRVAKIAFVPPALNWDEVSHGYNAYSILKTGKDEWGKTLPIIFRAYGDYKLPVYIYLTAISEFFLGLTPFSVRLVSVLAGVGSVVFTYLLVKELFKKERLALVSALLLAVEPWGLFFSRAALEANLALFLIVSGVYLLFKKKYLLSFILLGFSVWTYNSARIFVPLLLLSHFLIFKPKYKVGQLIVLSFFFLPMFWQLINPAGQARYEAVKIIDTGVVSQIIEKRGASLLPGVLPRLLYNRVTYFVSIFWANYFTHFSPDFLFFKGGSHYQFSVPGEGLLYAVSFPFFVIGLVRGLVDMRKTKAVLFTMLWLAISPIASSLTREAPHALRLIVMLPIPMVLTAVGIGITLDAFKKRGKTLSYLVTILIFLCYFFSLEKWGQAYVTNYRENYSWSWQYGMREVVAKAKAEYNNFDQIVVTKKYGEPHEFFLFFWPWDPKSYREDPGLIRFGQSNWFWVDRFAKFFFVNDWQMKDLVLESGGGIDCKTKSCLIFTSPGNANEDWKKVAEIKFLNGESAFEVYVTN